MGHSEVDKCHPRAQIRWELNLQKEEFRSGRVGKEKREGEKEEEGRGAGERTSRGEGRTGKK